MSTGCKKESGTACYHDALTRGEARIPTLDGWRCIAIVGVLFAHSWEWFGFGTAKLGRFLHYPGISTHFERAGLDGVLTFFCISGFLITQRLLSQKFSLKVFYGRRVFRILPPALTYLAVLAILSLLGFLSVTGSEIFASLAFYRNYLDRQAWFTGHFWSLSIEEQFYLFWPSVLHNRFVPPKVFVAVAIILIAVWRQLHWPLQDYQFFHTDMRLDAILCGCAMALFWPALKRFFARLPSIAAILGIFAFFAAERAVNLLQGFDDLIQAFIVCMLIGVTVTRPSSWLGTILENRFLAYIGRLSYSLYLWQQIFLYPAHTPHWQFPLRIAGVFLLAWLSYTVVEQPAITKGRHLFRGRPAGADSERALAAT